ncbi:MAG: rod shape-determining protein RodA [Nitrospirae bacterium]|nr:rod shape-determining protein RodA [Candidatus Manganitrophaceae bacterium]
MANQPMLSRYDKLLFVVLFLILAIGVLSIYSVTGGTLERSKTPFYLKQISWIIVGWIIFLVMAWVDYREMARFAYPIYGITLFLLVLVPLIGRTGMGARRWLSVGAFSFQPSELVKIGLLFALAKHFSDHYPNGGLDLKRLLISGSFLFIPFVLILKQPDLGTALSVSIIFISMLFVIGLRSRFLIYSSLITAMLSPFIGQLVWNNLKTYQKRRLFTFINPMEDPTGTGYQIIQSKIAIGSGGLFGKGFLEGTQSQLKFLPERHTDFIFSVLAEQWGFVGVLVLFVLFFLVILWAVDVAVKAKDLLGTLLAVGIIGLIFFYFFVNVGMTLGVMPVVGVPLPLVSYGGSAMVTTLGMLGLLLNIKVRRLMR